MVGVESEICATFDSNYIVYDSLWGACHNHYTRLGKFCQENLIAKPLKHLAKPTYPATHPPIPVLPA